jgi:hypothetical protein
VLSPGILTLKVYEQVSAPTNEDNLVGSAVYDGDTITTSSFGEWIVFDFGEGTEFNVTSGSQYWLLSETPSNGDASNYVRWRTDTSSGYPNGTFYYYFGAWAFTSVNDAMFEMHTTLPGPPTKAKNPAPTDANASVTLDQATITWDDGGGATTFSVYYGTTSGNLSLVSLSQGSTSFTVTGITDGSPYAYLSTRYWRIDSTNLYGTTTGDEWSFTTIRLTPPTPTRFYATTGQYYRLLIQSDGSYGDPPGVGVENTDFVYLAAEYEANFIATNRRLVAAAENKIWYEDI